MGDYFSTDEIFSLLDPLAGEGKELALTDDAINIIKEIKSQIEAMIEGNFKPAYILMNKRNYERLVAFIHNSTILSAKIQENGLVDELFDLDIVVWDVPIDYVNVRGKASVEFAYDEKTLRRNQA